MSPVWAISTSPGMWGGEVGERGRCHSRRCSGSGLMDSVHGVCLPTPRFSARWIATHGSPSICNVTDKRPRLPANRSVPNITPVAHFISRNSGRTDLPLVSAGIQINLRLAQILGDRVPGQKQVPLLVPSDGRRKLVEERLVSQTPAVDLVLEYEPCVSLQHLSVPRASCSVFAGASLTQ